MTRTNTHPARRSILLATALLACCALLPLAVSAQNVQHSKNSQDLGMRHDFKVDPVSLSLNVQITLGAYKGRGGATMPVALRYSSKLWRLDYAGYVVGGSVGQPDDNNYTKLNAVFGDPDRDRMTTGWSSTLELPRVINDPEWFNSSGMPCDLNDRGCTPEGASVPDAWYIRRVRLRMPGGATHELRADDNIHPHTEQITYPITYSAVDGSRLRYTLTGDLFSGGMGIIHLPDGSRYETWYNSSFLDEGRFIDRHGNTLTYGAGGVWTDALGRSVSLESMPGFDNTTVNHTFTYRQLKVEGHPEESALTDFDQLLHYYGNGTWNGAAATYPALFDSLSGADRIGSGGVFNPEVLYQITAPDGSKYTLTYNINGEIDKIVYPTGGYERFEYAAVEGVTVMNWPYTLTNRGVVKRWVSPDGTAAAEQEWQYLAEPVNNSVLQTTVVAPDGTVTDRYVHRGRLPYAKYFGFDEAKSGMVFEECFYAPGAQHGDRGAMLRRNLTEWGQTDYVKQWAGVPGGFHVTSDPRVNRAVDVILDTNGGDAPTKTTAYQYDADLNVRETSEYGFRHVPHSTGLANVGQVGAVGSFQAGMLLRTSESVFLVNDPNVDESRRAEYRARNLLSLPTSGLVKDGAGNIVSQAVTRYDETAYPVISCPDIAGWANPPNTALGNATTARVWLNTNNTWVETHARYDQAGNARESRDAHADNDPGHGRLSEFLYSTLYQYNYLEQAKSPAPDPTGVNGSSAPLVTSSTYDVKTGLPITVTDASGQVTRFYYVDGAGNVDPLSRLRKVESPDGGWTAYEYGNTPNGFFVRTRTAIDATRSTDAYRYLDGLGRPTRSYSYDGSAADRVWVAVKTSYDTLGRASTISNPHFRDDLSDFTPAADTITSTEYDYLGRVRMVTTPDGAFVTSAYVGSEVTVTDQDLKQRRSVSDALGRLIMVYEDPAGVNYETSYEYDTPGNLTKVIQGKPGQTQQTRTFAYDSLGRLALATNPEVCQQQQGEQCVAAPVTYEYDAGGNLKKKTDARQVQSEYEYDALGRLIRRTYSVAPGQPTPPAFVATPTVEYFYDGRGMPAGVSLPEYAHGRLTAVKSSVSETAYTEFDVMGRVKKHRQVMDLGTAGVQTYKMAYSYNLTGAVTSQTYPSDKVITTEYDAAGRVAGVKNQATNFFYAGGGAADAANRISYAAHGAVSALKLGNDLWEHTAFNSRLQPTEIGLGTSEAPSGKLLLDYGYGANNNGNVRSQRIRIDGALDLTQTYDYDAVNRLLWAREAQTADDSQTWKQQFTYADAAGQNAQFGNRRLDPGHTTQNVLPPSNPQIDPANNRFAAQQGYSYDDAGNLTGEPGGRTYAYDAENHLTTVNGGLLSGVGAEYAYDGDGRRVQKVTTAETTVFVYDAMGKLVAEYSNQSAGGGTSYLTQDHLGSTRVVTDQNQTVSRHDYLPFGEETGAGIGGRTTNQGYVADGIRQKFAGSERDGETGLDFMQARYMSSMQGRFTSTDPLYLELRRLTDPQKFNLYVYARNNPLRFIDPNGLEITVKDKTTDGIGDDEYQRIVNGRKGANFQISINSKNKVIIVDAKGKALGKNDLKALGKTLSGGEKELFSAITDTRNNATVNIVRNDPDIFHGAYEKKGENTIDVGDANKLSSPGNAGGRTAYDSIGHETLEAFYTVSKNIGETAAHQQVNAFFPGLGLPINTGRIGNRQTVVGWRGDFPVAGQPNTYERTEFTYVTPIPANQYRQHSGKGVNIKSIEKVP